MTDDATSRFTNRVGHYVAARPTYPGEAVDFALAGLKFGATVADVGAGTGIFSRLLIVRGMRVIAVDPNRAMLAAAVEASANQAFVPIVARAEATGLAENSVDLIAAAQAFHWFDADTFAVECRRILKPGGKVALLWNARCGTGDAFAEGYEALLNTLPEYRRVNHRGVSDAELKNFFGGTMQTGTFRLIQRLDWPSLRARAVSSSYVPAEGTPQYAPFTDSLRSLHNATADERGSVCITYDTNVYLGQPLG